MTRLFRPSVAWMLGTLPLAPLSAVAYFFSEWLFFITKPSTVASLPLGKQLVVLLQSPWPVLPVLMAAQLVASLLSMIRYPRVRGLALAPSAAIGGVLLLLLIDNFTYTLFGFGVLTVSTPVRLLYAALLPSLIALVGWKLQQMVGARTNGRDVALRAATLIAVMAIAVAVPRSVLHAEPDAALVAAAATPASPTDLPNIFFLGIDGVDASALSAYGASRETTPFLEHFRDESLFFENAFSNVGRTHGSLVALLTGRLPFATHVTFPPTILQGEDAHRHLPALLKQRGYTTLQLGMRHYADAEDANLLGFDAANYRWEQVEDVHAGPAQDEVDTFRAAIAERLDERIGQLFGFRHAIDGFAHVEGKRETPYWSDERRVDTLRRYFRTAPQPWFVHAHLLDTHCCAYHPRQMHFSGGDLKEDARDSQLRETDAQLRSLFDGLYASGVLDRTIVVISSDHTNGWTTKGRVPLMIRFPHQQHRGRVATNVQLVDVAPTIVDFLGMSPPAWMEGQSLLNPAALAPTRPIFGVSEITGRQVIGPYLTTLTAAGPPNYGAGTATLVIGKTWFELDMQTGALTSGPVPGHTGQGPVPVVSEEQARALLLAKLGAGGFQVGN